MLPALLRELFEAEVAVEVLSDFALADPLHPDELVHVAKAVEKRHREFRAGRSCARRALRVAGADAPGALPALPDRRVGWPEGYTGSISHADGIAAAVVAPLHRAFSLGLDVEALGRVTTRLYEQIADAGEIAWIQAGGPTVEAARATQIFSAKEAFYKAQYPLTETFLGFHDVRYVSLGEDRFEIEVREPPPALRARGSRFPGRLLTYGAHVWSAVTFAPRGAGVSRDS